MGLLLLQMGLLLLGLRRAQASSEAAPATARTQREVYVVTRSVFISGQSVRGTRMCTYCTYIASAATSSAGITSRPLELPPPRHAAQRRAARELRDRRHTAVDVSSRDLFI